MATPRRMIIFRTLLMLCLIATLLLPGLLLSGKGITSKPSRVYSFMQMDDITAQRVSKLKQERNLRLKQNLLQKKSAGMVNPAPGIFALDPEWTGDNIMGHVRQNKDTADVGKRMAPPSPSHELSVNNPQQIVQAKKTTKTFNWDKNKTEHQQAFLGDSAEMSTALREINTWNSSGLTCREIHQVAFVKTHKTGGTTVMNIIQRFGHVRDLVFVLPKAGNYLGFGQTVHPMAVLPPPKGKKYDMLINHVVYSRLSFRIIMPSEAVYITIIRHPLAHFVSSIEYLKGRVNYIKQLSRENPATDYLQDPQHHEPADYKWSFTNNRMSFDLGLDHRFFHKSSRIEQFIKDLDRDFKLVMITGHMDESLLLLKRYLCWTLKDILYVSRNVNTKKMKYNFTTAEIERHKEWAEADYKLYDFFLSRFWNQVAAEGDEFGKELKNFKLVLSKVKTHCLWVNKTGSSKTLTIKSSMFNPTIVLQKIDCVYMLMEEVPFVMSTRKKHLKTIRQSGIDVLHRRQFHRPRKFGVNNNLLYKRRPRRPVLARRRPR